MPEPKMNSVEQGIWEILYLIFGYFYEYFPWFKMLLSKIDGFSMDLGCSLNV